MLLAVSQHAKIYHNVLTGVNNIDFVRRALGFGLEQVKNNILFVIDCRVTFYCKLQISRFFLRNRKLTFLGQTF